MSHLIAFLSGAGAAALFLTVIGYRDRVRDMLQRRRPGSSSRRRVDALRRIQP